MCRCAGVGRSSGVVGTCRAFGDCGCFGNGEGDVSIWIGGTASGEGQTKALACTASMATTRNAAEPSRFLLVLIDHTGQHIAFVHETFVRLDQLAGCVATFGRLTLGGLEPNAHLGLTSIEAVDQRLHLQHLGLVLGQPRLEREALLCRFCQFRPQAPIFVAVLARDVLGIVEAGPELGDFEFHSHHFFELAHGSLLLERRRRRGFVAVRAGWRGARQHGQVIDLLAPALLLLVSRGAHPACVYFFWTSNRGSNVDCHHTAGSCDCHIVMSAFFFVAAVIAQMTINILRKVELLRQSARNCR